MSLCLVTGGAGFIGCALSKHLADAFDEVVVVDNLLDQVHPTQQRPKALDERVELVVGDSRDAKMWDELLGARGLKPTVVVDLAAETGTGQSLLQATRHASVNVVGTTELLDALVRHEALPERVVLTSSRAVYGEGAWRAEDGAVTYPGQRTKEMFEQGQWDFDGLTALPFVATETWPRPTSVYGATKLAQEHILSSWCLSLGVTPVMYRLQNVYGPGQSLSNPYTGIVSFFTQAAKAGKSLPVYEDGDIVRDFVYIDDVVSALMAGILRGEATQYPYDIGSGEATTIMRLAEIAANLYQAPAPHITGQFRQGDVRHASTNIERSEKELDWKPQVMVEEGVKRLSEWIDAGADGQIALQL